MEGISKERLKELKETMPDGMSKLFMHALIRMCKELHPWSPINESTPRDRPLLVYYPGYGLVVETFDDSYNGLGFHHYDEDLNENVRPTLYQELPQDPGV